MLCNIQFEWWNNEKQRGMSIPEEHKDTLENHAISRVKEMRQEYYIAGELNAEIEGIKYSGWWEFKE